METENCWQITFRLKMFPDYAIIPKKNRELCLLPVTSPSSPHKCLSFCSESQRNMYYSVIAIVLPTSFNHVRADACMVHCNPGQLGSSLKLLVSRGGNSIYPGSTNFLEKGNSHPLNPCCEPGTLIYIIWTPRYNSGVTESVFLESRIRLDMETCIQTDMSSSSH